MKKLSIVLFLSFILLVTFSALAWAADDYGFDNNLALHPTWFATNTSGNLAGHATTQPIFNIGTNGSTCIRESVYIELPCDTDNDGLRDLVHAYIVRLPQTNSGLKSPVFMQISPYRDGTPTYLPEWPVTGALKINTDTSHYTYANDVDDTIVKGKPRAAFWPWDNLANPTLGIPAPRNTATNTAYQGTATTSITVSGWYSYFVTRGYAYAYINSIGSRHAQGFSNCGGIEETLASVAFANWLNGKAQGFANPQCTIKYIPEWSNGLVGIGGTSYNGTLPIAAACTGNPYIRAIMPVEAISSWYDYYRDNGAVIAPGECHGEDADVLTDYVFSRRISNGDTTTVKNNNGTGSLLTYAAGTDANGTAYPANTNFSTALYNIYWNTYLPQINVDQDRNSGDYNWFWDERNYLATADKVTAGVFIMHGTNDWNVKYKHFDQFWRALDEKAPNVVKKAFIHLGAHNHITTQYQSGYMPYLHLFLDHFLFGIDNGAERHDVIPNVNIANNSFVYNGHLNWDHFETWPPAGADYRKLYLTPTAATTTVGVLKTTAPAPATESFKDATIPTWSSTNQSNWDNLVVGGDNSSTGANWKPLVPRANSLSYYSEPLTEDVRLSGCTKVTITATPDKGTGYLSAALVELGTNTRSFSTSNADVPAALRTFGGENGGGSFALVNYTLSTTTTPYKIVTRGSVDIQNPNPTRQTWMDAGSQSFIPDYYFQTKAIVPGNTYEYTFTMEPLDYTFKTGQRLGIVVYSTDMRYTLLNYASSPKLDITLGENTFVEIPLKYNIRRDAVGVEIDSGAAKEVTIAGASVNVFARDNKVQMTYTISRPAGAFSVDLPYNAAYLAATTVELFKNGNVAIAPADGTFSADIATPGLIKAAFTSEADVSGLTIVATFDLVETAPVGLVLPMTATGFAASALDPLKAGLIPMETLVSAGAINVVDLGGITFVAGAANGTLGDTVNVTYSVQGNLYGLSSFDLDLPFIIGKYTPVSVTANARLSSGTLSNSISGNILHVTFSAPANIAGDGALFTVAYKLNDTIETALTITANQATYTSPLSGKVLDYEQLAVTPGYITAKTYLVKLVPRLVAGVYYVDVIISGGLNYTQLAAEIEFDAGKLTYNSFTATGVINTCALTANNKVTLRTVPSTNMVLGGACTATPVMTLKFTPKAGQTGAALFKITTATVSPPAGYLGTTTAVENATINL